MNKGCIPASHKKGQSGFAYLTQPAMRTKAETWSRVLMWTHSWAFCHLGTKWWVHAQLKIKVDRGIVSDYVSTIFGGKSQFCPKASDDMYKLMNKWSCGALDPMPCEMSRSLVLISDINHPVLITWQTEHQAGWWIGKQLAVPHWPIHGRQYICQLPLT